MKTPPTHTLWINGPHNYGVAVYICPPPPSPPRDPHTDRASPSALSLAAIIRICPPPSNPFRTSDFFFVCHSKIVRYPVYVPSKILRYGVISKGEKLYFEVYERGGIPGRKQKEPILVIYLYIYINWQETKG